MWLHVAPVYPGIKVYYGWVDKIRILYFYDPTVLRGFIAV